MHLSATQYSLAITCFSLSYMLANPVWGAWMDRVGLFRAALVAVALWSVASGAHAFIAGVASLCLARAVLGFGEGATFPAGLKTVADTLPPHRQATGLAVAYSGGSLGAALTPLIVVPLATRFGWRAAFLVSLAAGLLWLALWGLLRQHLQPIPPDRRPLPTADAHPSPLPSTNLDLTPPSPLGRPPRFHRDLFATALVYGLGAAPLAYGLYAAPLYLSRVLHVSQSSLGHLLWLPPLGWEAGYLLWGRVADFRRARHLTNPLPLFIAFAALGLVLPAISLCARLPHAVALSLLGFVLTMFFAAGFVVFALADGLRRQQTPHSTPTFLSQADSRSQANPPPQQQGSDAGFLAGFCISAWALATGILMPILGRLFDTGHPTASLCAMAAIPPLGVLAWRLLRTPEAPALTANPAGR